MCLGEFRKLTREGQVTHTLDTQECVKKELLVKISFSTAASLSFPHIPGESGLGLQLWMDVVKITSS